MDYLTPLKAFVADLSTDALPATLDRQTLNPPGVFVTLTQFDDYRLFGGGTAQVRLYVAIGERNTLRALEDLQPHLATVLEFLEGAGLPLLEPIVSELLPAISGGADLPCFRITTNIIAN